jgi:catechol 2,3-dioxygenase-like lactoylglutathione lyase family enzyme
MRDRRGWVALAPPVGIVLQQASVSQSYDGREKMDVDQTVSLNLVALRASDLDRAATFYAALGLNLTRHSHGNGPVHLAHESAGLVFEVYPQTTDGMRTNATRIGFSVPSVDEAYLALLAAGGASVSPPRASLWGRRAVVSDPDGHRVELTTK